MSDMKLPGLDSHLEDYGSDSDEPQPSGPSHQQPGAHAPAIGPGSYLEQYGSDSDSDRQANTPSGTPAHPLTLDIPGAEPYRLQNLLGPDSHSPTTPTNAADLALFARYSSASTLPPMHDDPDQAFVSFGSVEVPREAADDYQQLRLHAIQAPEGRKILFAAEQTLTRRQENGEDALVDRVRVYPYQPGTNEINDLDGGTLTAKARAFYTRNEAGETIGNVTFDAREGMFTHSGGQQSAATGGLHELHHLVVGPGVGSPMTGFIGKLEHHTIINAENPVARANHEEPRDTHDDAGHYQTTQLRSTSPMDPRTREVIESHRELLRHATARMDAQQLGAGHVEHPDVIERQRIAKNAANRIKIFERTRKGDRLSQISSAGNSVRSGDLEAGSSEGSGHAEASDVEMNSPSDNESGSEEMSE